MRNLEDVKSEEWQEYINIIAKGAKFKQTIFNNQADSTFEIAGIEYEYNYENESVSDLIPFCEPTLITKLYENNIDITMPLQQLNIIYTEMDKTNAVLFDYAMNVNRILNMPEIDNDDSQKKLREIKKLNKIIS